MKVHLPPLAFSWDAQSHVQGRLEGFKYKWVFFSLSTLLYFNFLKLSNIFMQSNLLVNTKLVRKNEFIDCLIFILNGSKVSLK